MKFPNPLEKITSYIDKSQLQFALIVYSIPLVCFLINKFQVQKFQSLFSLATLILLYGFYQTGFLLIYVFINIILIYQLRNQKFKENYSFCFSMISLFFFHFYFKILKIPDERDICSSVMMVNIMIFWVSKEFIFENDKLSDMFNYLMNMGGIFFGPPITYNMFMKRHLEEKNQKDEKKQKEEKVIKKEKSNFFKDNEGLSSIFISIIYLAIHVILSKNFTFSENRKNFLKDFIYMVVSSFSLRCKFYFIWTLSSSYFHYLGYENIKNIFPWKIETSKNVKDLTSSWNVYTNLWLKESVFMPFKKTNNTLAGVLTFFASSFFHGPNICYAIMFLTFAFISKPIKELNERISKLEKYIGKFFANLLLNVQMFVMLSYLCVPFVSLNLSHTYKVWKSVYFFGHFHLLLCLSFSFLKNIKIKT